MRDAWKEESQLREREKAKSGKKRFEVAVGWSEVGRERAESESGPKSSTSSGQRSKTGKRRWWWSGVA